MEVNGQAVVIDALFFLMICGVTSAGLMWAGSVYGDTALEGYQHMYLNDFEAGAINALSMTEYKVDDGPLRVWLDEVGNYMLGEFNKTNPRYTEGIEGQWERACSASPAPVLLVLSTEDSRVPEERRTVRLACGRLLDHTWGCDDCGQGCEEGDVTKSLNETTFIRNRGYECHINEYKYTYFSSPIRTKNCGLVICDLQAKIYY